MSALVRGIALAMACSAIAAKARAQRLVPASASSVIGTWRGTSICTAAGKPTCHDEVVVYHVRKSAPATASADSATATSGAERIEIEMNKIVNAKEESMATLTCSHASRPHLVACPMRGWAWTFELRGDTLGGTLANPGGTVWRNVRVSRVSGAK